MRRRPKEDPTAEPRELRFYDPADWGGDADAPTRWYAARDRRRREHGESAADADAAVVVWPDVPFRYEDI